MAASDFQVTGKNTKALFTLKLHRGDGMCLVAMNWKNGKPPNDFVGFAIESKPPGGNTFFPLNNRLTFAGADGEVNPIQLSTLVSPIQKFRWVHFPRNANLDGEFTYRVTPIFMDEEDRLSQGEPQEAGIELRRETYPGQVNVTFTRGFVSSQAFVDRYEKFGKFNTLIPCEGEGRPDVQGHASQKRTKHSRGWASKHERRSSICSIRPSRKKPTFASSPTISASRKSSVDLRSLRRNCESSSMTARSTENPAPAKRNPQSVSRRRLAQPT